MAAVSTVTTTAVPESAVSTFDAETLVHDLRKVFRSGTTRDLEWREHQLRQLAKMCREGEKELCQAVKEDLGRGTFDTFAEVLMPATEALKTAKEIHKWAKPRRVPTDAFNFPGTSEIVAEPYGVVLILAPWNFPLTTGFGPLIGAIAAGNCVVLKPSEVAPACSKVMKRLMDQYLDTSAIKVVEGGPDVAVKMMEQKWDKVFFTGGVEIGRKVAVAAAKHLTPVALELGGKNPCYVDSTADLKVACRRITYGAFVNAGQICLKPEYILVEETIASKFVEQMRQTLEEFYGPDFAKSPDFSRIVSERHVDRLAGLLSDPRVKECVVLGGTWDKSDKYVAPTLLRDVPWDTALMQEETFGPIVAIQSVGSLEEAIAIVNDRPKPLALYVFSSQDSVANRIIRETSSGAVSVNETVLHTCNPNLPFGGVGDSGMGSYHGRFSFDCFSHEKPVLKKGTGGDVAFRYPPASMYKEKVMRALFDFDLINLVLLLLGLKK